jgi:ribulose-5-phosphate 4-epimerase/fuculose-1-phosphate aldolase
MTHMSENGLRDGPALPELSPHQELALLARTLHREGYDDHLAGHISYRQPDGTLLVNPFGLTWDEIRAGDVVRIDLDGRVLDGAWTVSPAIELHLALHRARDDVQVAVHNHPVWGTVWADLHEVPPVLDQSSALVAGDVVLYDTYEGTVNVRANAEAVIAGLGDARMALLANHGVLVAGKDIAQAHHRCVVLEWRCRQAWRARVAGGGVPLRPDQYDEMAGFFDLIAFPGLWEAMVRRELRADPLVLDGAPTPDWSPAPAAAGII